MFAMAGASWEHTLIKDNLAREAGNQLKGGPCQVVTSDLRVKVNATGLYTYPDLVVVCDQPQFSVRQADDTWVLTAFSELTETLDFRSVAASILLAEIYRGVQLPETPNR